MRDWLILTASICFMCSLALEAFLVATSVGERPKVITRGIAAGTIARNAAIISLTITLLEEAS